MEILIEKIEGFGGQLVEVASSGFLAAFGVPPVEDAPSLAARAALDDDTGGRRRRLEQSRRHREMRLVRGCGRNTTSVSVHLQRERELVGPRDLVTRMLLSVVEQEHHSEREREHVIRVPQAGHQLAIDERTSTPLGIFGSVRCISGGTASHNYPQ
jgi:hypothetical protein